MSYYLILGVAYASYMYLKTLEDKTKPASFRRIYRKADRANRAAMFMYRTIAWPVDILQGITK